MSDDDEKDLRERILAARIYMSQAMSRQRKANNALRRVIHRMELLEAQNNIALHSMWSSVQNFDGILHALDERIAASRYSKN